MIATEYCKNVFDGTHDSPKFLDNGYLLVTSKNIANRELDLTGANFISEEDYNKINERSKVHQWDIFFSMIGTVGNVFLQTEKEVNYAIKNMGVFSCENEDKAKWLYYYLQSPYFKKLMNSLLSGAVQKFVPLGFLRSIDIPKYDDNKKAIVKFLSSLDDKIALNNRINAKLEQMAKRLYDHWFVQFDFPVSCHSELVSESHSEEMLNQVQHDECAKPYKSTGGKMDWNEELKREIPEGWEVKKLGTFFTTNRGVSYSTKTISGDKGIPMINLASFSPDGSYKIDGIKTYTGEYTNEKVLKPFDLVMCNTQQTAIDFSKDIIGKALLVPDIFEGDITSSHHVNTLKTQNEKLKFYLYRLFNTDYFHAYISHYASGTNIMGLDFAGVENYSAVIPSKEVLSKFADFTLNIEKMKSEIILQNKKLISLRDRLLPLLMNGQVEVK